jgi:hypothetical protein
MKLSLLAILLGVGMGFPQVFGLMKPKEFAEKAKRFPRNVPVGVILMLLATAWFDYNVNAEPIADFSSFKPYLLAGFAAVGVMACIFIQDYLAVRGLAVLALLLAKLMVDTGRVHLGQSPFVLVIQAWAYVLIIAGIWLTITPWRLRDLLNFAVATEQRVRIGSAIRLTWAIFIIVLGLTVFRSM